MTTELDFAALRDIAKAATQGPWEDRINDLTDEVMVVHDCEYVLDIARTGGDGHPQSVADARHIAAFDPPTALDLLDRLEAAEADSKVLRSAVETSNDAWAALTTRAEDAEKKIAAVREVHKPVPVYTTEAGDCEHDGDCEAVEISAGSYCPVHTDGLTCNECAELAEHADDLPAYPCPTITALGGQDV